jgi:hypothetical protein
MLKFFFILWIFLPRAIAHPFYTYVHPLKMARKGAPISTSFYRDETPKEICCLFRSEKIQEHRALKILRVYQMCYS